MAKADKLDWHTLSNAQLPDDLRKSFDDLLRQKDDIVQRVTAIFERSGDLPAGKTVRVNINLAWGKMSVAMADKAPGSDSTSAGFLAALSKAPASPPAAVSAPGKATKTK